MLLRRPYTNWPSFLTVELNPSAAHETFVALHEAQLTNGDVQVPYDRQRVHNAPMVPTGQGLSTREGTNCSTTTASRSEESSRAWPTSAAPLSCPKTIPAYLPCRRRQVLKDGVVLGLVR